MRGDPNLCGPDCSYRQLFEGSQASLADMAAKQAQALSRVGRIRSSLVTTLRKNFPDMAAHAEQNLGRRLSDIDDEILLAYLDAFLANVQSQDHTATLRGLRDALTALGIPLEGDDPLSWVEQVHHHRTSRRAAVPEATGPWSPQADRPTPRAPAAGAHTPPPIDQIWDATPARPAAPGPAFPPSVDETGDAWADDWPPEPAPREPTPPARPAATGAQKTLGELFAAPAPDLWPGGLGDPSPEPDKWTPSPVRPAPEPAPRAGAPAAVPPPDPAPLTRWPSTAAVPDGEGHRPAPDAGIEPVGGPGTADTRTAGEKVPAPRERTVIQPPLRPELVVAPSPKKRTRTTRTQATPPADLGLDVPMLGAPMLGVDNPAVLDDQLRQALLAAASIPRPVFSRDLVGVGGSGEIIEAWEAECKADPESVPVRFIAPKSRHRLRGPLVVVETGGAPRPADWWQQCVRKYRTARLYELGVLLHRVGDEVVSFTLADDAAVLRLDTPRGLVGVLVVFDNRFDDGEATAAALEKSLEKLLSERLTLIAVLTTSGENGSLESLTAAARQVIQRNGWSLAAPVVAARSWEYADDRGSSAVMVIDGTETGPAS